MSPTKVFFVYVYTCTSTPKPACMPPNSSEFVGQRERLALCPHDMTGTMMHYLVSLDSSDGFRPVVET